MDTNVIVETQRGEVRGGYARVNHAGGKRIGDAKALLDLAQNKMPASDDSSPPSNLATTVLSPTGDRPGSGS